MLAVDALTSLAGSGSSIDAQSAQLIAESLTSVSNAASSASSDPGGPSGSLAVYSGILKATEALADSSIEGFSAAGQAPMVVSTPVIQMAVSLDQLGPGSRLFSAPLSAPGSPSSFDALPEGVFDNAGGGAVSTTFLSLQFDPHSNGSSTDGGSSGMTRLAFGSAGGEVDVSGLERPITFTLPSVTLPNGTNAACTFWNATTSTYEQNGCTQLPNPVPPGHGVFWLPNLTTPTDESLAWAWNLTGPMARPRPRPFFSRRLHNF